MMDECCGVRKERRQWHKRLPQHGLREVCRNLRALLGQKDGATPESIYGGECASKEVGSMEISGTKSEHDWFLACRKKGGQVFREAVLCTRFQ